MHRRLAAVAGADTARVDGALCKTPRAATLNCIANQPKSDLWGNEMRRWLQIAAILTLAWPTTGCVMAVRHFAKEANRSSFQDKGPGSFPGWHIDRQGALELDRSRLSLPRHFPTQQDPRACQLLADRASNRRTREVPDRRRLAMGFVWQWRLTDQGAHRICGAWHSTAKRTGHENHAKFDICTTRPHVRKRLLPPLMVETGLAALEHAKA